MGKLASLLAGESVSPATSTPNRKGGKLSDLLAGIDQESSVVPVPGKTRKLSDLLAGIDEPPPIEEAPQEEPLSEFGQMLTDIWTKPLETLPEMALKSQASLFPMLGAIKGIKKVFEQPQAPPLQQAMTFAGESLPYMPPLRDPIMAGIPGAIHAGVTGQDIGKGFYESTMTAPQPVADFPLPWSPPPKAGKRYDWKRLLDEAHTIIRPDASPAEKKALYTLGSTLNLVSDPYMWGLETGLVRAIKAKSLPEIVKYADEAINMAKGLTKKPGAMPEIGLGKPELLPLGEVKGRLETMPPPVRPSVTIARPPFSEAETALKGKKPSPPTVLPEEKPIPLPGEVPKQPQGIIVRPQLMPPATPPGGGEFSPFIPPRIPEQKLLPAPPPPPPPIQLPRPATPGAIPNLKAMPKYAEKPPAPPEPPPKGRMVSEIPILGKRPPAKKGLFPAEEIPISEIPRPGIVIPGKKAGVPGKIGIYGSTPKQKLVDLLEKKPAVEVPEPPPLPIAKKAEPSLPPEPPKIEVSKPPEPPKTPSGEAKGTAGKEPWEMNPDELSAKLKTLHPDPITGNLIGIDESPGAWVGKNGVSYSLREHLKLGDARLSPSDYFLKTKFLDRKTSAEAILESHKKKVAFALKKGEPVHPDSIKKYPDLAAKYGKSEVAPPPPLPKGEVGKVAPTREELLRIGVEETRLSTDRRKIIEYLNSRKQIQGHSSFLLNEINTKFPQIPESRLIDFFDHLRNKSHKAIYFDRTAGLDTLSIDAEGGKFLSDLISRDIDPALKGIAKAAPKGEAGGKLRDIAKPIQEGKAPPAGGKAYEAAPPIDLTKPEGEAVQATKKKYETLSDVEKDNVALSNMKRLNLNGKQAIDVAEYYDRSRGYSSAMRKQAAGADFAMLQEKGILDETGAWKGDAEKRSQVLSEWLRREKVKIEGKASPEGAIGAIKESLSVKASRPSKAREIVDEAIDIIVEPFTGKLGVGGITRPSAQVRAGAKKIKGSIQGVYDSFAKKTSETVKAVTDKAAEVIAEPLQMSVDEASYGIKKFLGGETAASSPGFMDVKIKMLNEREMGVEMEKAWRKVTGEYKDPATGKTKQFSDADQLRMWEYKTGERPYAPTADPKELILQDRGRKLEILHNKLGQEMVDLDLLSQRSFFNKHGIYLRRLYEEKEKGLYDTLLQRFKVKRPPNSSQLDLSQYKQRFDSYGVEWQVGNSPSEYKTFGRFGDVKNAGEAERNAFIIQQRTLAKAQGKKFRTIKKWSPMSEEARTALGEVRRVDYPTADFILRSTSNIAIENMIKDAVARGEAQRWVLDPKDIAKSQLLKGGAWGKMPDKIAGMYKLPESKKLGELSGKYVAPEVYDTLMEMRRLEPKELIKIAEGWQSIYGVWKKWKTVWDPAVQAANRISNWVITDIGGHGRSIPEGEIILRKKSEAYQLARQETDLLLGGFPESELFKVRKAFYGKKDGVWGIIKDKARALDDWTQETYSAAEKAGKLGIFSNALRDRGITPDMIKEYLKTGSGIPKTTIKEAAAEANYWMLNYRTRPGFVKIWSNLPVVGSPFLTYYWYMIPRIARASLGIGRAGFNPGLALRFWKYPLIFGAIEEYSRNKFNLSKEEVKDIKANYPKWMQSPIAQKLNAFPLLPWTSEYKTPEGKMEKEYQVLPTVRLTPWGSIAGTSMRFIMAEPFSAMINDIARNESTFGKYQIVKDFERHPYMKKMEYAWRQMAPSWAGGYSFQKVYSAAIGQEDYAGRKRTVAMALVDTILAMKIQPVNVQKGYEQRLTANQKQVVEIKKQITLLHKGLTFRGESDKEKALENKWLQENLEKLAAERLEMLKHPPKLPGGEFPSGKKLQQQRKYKVKPPRLSNVPPPPMRRSFGGIPSPPPLR